MRDVVVQVVVEERTARQAYELICDFRRYPELTDKVDEVVVHPPEADGSLRSDWSVIFRNGLMRWSELDRFVPETLTVEFEQIKGDFEIFRGSWVCEERESEDSGGAVVTVVTFRSEFDLGIPSLAEILDPVAESTLRDNILRILEGLMGRVIPMTPMNLTAARHG
ncbi:SRPBCC family protein [Streptomyces turgidiscabies]|uniref:Ribosome-associated toxin RatA of RatAB toxin-antitoxin module n=1 Tax=Streptomyces turgidiscabies TaxID=85558 RepID=A0ABU0RF89_9ACTN|nr:SRPBCC family protein [Streptomyces turgidiscabies]MDQ0930651.1 ribosome-associated toxin RatA of RatAB toxin-antitoxin module [Streptomyces turgidiscabies]